VCSIAAISRGDERTGVRDDLQRVSTRSVR
jgi:hypothetical protein